MTAAGRAVESATPKNGLAILSLAKNLPPNYGWKSNLGISRKMRFRLRTLMIVVALASAICGYGRLYFSCTTGIVDIDAETLRCYRSRWQARLFRPAAAVESAIIGRHVSTTGTILASK